MRDVSASLRAWADRKLARRSPRAVYRRGMGLVVTMGILALIASGVFDGLRGRTEPALASGQSAGEQHRVSSADLSGRAHVFDGDTIEVGGERVRLIGIDAPEGRQTCTAGGRTYRCGADATKAVKQMIGGRPVECTVYGRDRYGRALAECFTDCSSINAAIARAGRALAWYPATGAVLGPRYDDAEAEAATAGAGMWLGEFVQPWVWRQR
jgi:endonuclease YncB( thermonuclease family)